MPSLQASDANSLLIGTGNYFGETGNLGAKTGNFIGRIEITPDQIFGAGISK